MHVCMYLCCLLSVRAYVCLYVGIEYRIVNSICVSECICAFPLVSFGACPCDRVQFIFLICEPHAHNVVELPASQHGTLMSATANQLGLCKSANQVCKITSKRVKLKDFQSEIIIISIIIIIIILIIIIIIIIIITVMVFKLRL